MKSHVSVVKLGTKCDVKLSDGICRTYDIYLIRIWHLDNIPPIVGIIFLFDIDFSA